MTRTFSRRRWAAAALAAALAAVPTAVVGTADAGTPAGFARFYGQKVKWQACSVDDVVQD